MNVFRYVLLSLLVIISQFSWGQQLDDFFANGHARYTDLGKEVYIGGLYLGLPSSDPQAIREYERKRMEIKVTAQALASRRFTRMLVNNVAINNPPQLLTDNAVAMEQFLSWFKGNFEQGDHIVLENTPSGFELSINSIKLAEIQSDNLFNMLLNTWIGDVPPNRDFKAKILGDSRGGDIAYEFSVLVPASERIALVRGWKDQVRDQLIAAEAEKVAIAQLNAEKQAKQAALAKAKQRKEQQAEAKRIADEKKKTEAKKIAAEKKKAVAREERIAADKKKKDTDNEFSAENILAAQLYANKLMVHSQRKMDYPDVSWRLGQQGRVVVNVTIDREGKLVDYELAEKSRYLLLNNAVEKGIRKAEPYPAIPIQIQGETLDFQVPVTFKIST